jgi:tetraacyldisaccharide 4'-kinase
MRAPGFWWRARPNWAARLLSPIGWIYGAITLRRMRRPGQRAAVPVICVGNFTAGGAGKTPTVLALATRLRQRGDTPVLLTRGYGGRLTGPIQVDLARHGPADVGDEALLLARRAPTIVARDRVAGAALAVAAGASVIVMDDGLHNPGLDKQLSLAVVDGPAGVGNGLCLPAGPLRAPLVAQLRQVQGVLIIGAGEPGLALGAVATAAGIAVIEAVLAPLDVGQALSGRRVVAVAGIGRPAKFSETLDALGAILVAERPFPDHHPYTADDVAALVALAEAEDCLVATTDKDMTKLAALWPEADRHRLVVVPVALEISSPAALDALLEPVLTRVSGPASAL